MSKNVNSKYLHAINSFNFNLKVKLIHLPYKSVLKVNFYVNEYLDSL